MDYGNQQAMSAHLEHMDQITESDRHTITAVAVNVRVAAVEVLGQIAEKGDQHAITAVSTCLEDQNLGVRQAAVDVLGKIAEKGDQHTITAVSTRLEDQNSRDRHAAVKNAGPNCKEGRPARHHCRAGHRCSEWPP